MQAVDQTWGQDGYGLVEFLFQDYSTVMHKLSVN